MKGTKSLVNIKRERRRRKHNKVDVGRRSSLSYPVHSFFPLKKKRGGRSNAMEGCMPCQTGLIKYSPPGLGTKESFWAGFITRPGSLRRVCLKLVHARTERGDCWLSCFSLFILSHSPILMSPVAFFFFLEVHPITPPSSTSSSTSRVSITRVCVCV